MSETQMPVAEATVANERELVSYEFAFHVLPTVTEGEVSSVVDLFKTHITTAGGQIFDEEAPERFDLAYEIAKYMEGRNRRFSSAYFGWIRFRLEAANLASLTEHIEGSKDVLRFLIVKLTKVEEASPFRFHESIADRKVRNIGDQEVAEVAAEVAEEVAIVDAEAEVEATEAGEAVVENSKVAL
jgi:ribosomal protein S6